MGSRTDFLSNSPHLFYELEETAAPFDDTQGNGADGTVQAGTASDVATAVHGTGIELTSGGRIELDPTHYVDIRTAEDWSVVFACNPGSGSGYFHLSYDGGNLLGAEGPIYVQIEDSNIEYWYSFIEGIGGTPSLFETNITIPASTNGGWYIVGVSYNHTSKQQKLFVDGSLVQTETAANASFYRSSGTDRMNIAASGGVAQFDTIATFLTELDETTMELLTSFTAVTYDVHTPDLELYVGTAEAYTPELELRVTDPTVHTPELELHVEGFSESHITAASAAWRLDVQVDGTSVDLITRAATDFAERESPTASVQFLPPSGVIDPEEWENQPITIDFIGVENGADIYTIRRFTGVTEVAVFDPDEGTLTLTATADLQAKCDTLSRADLDYLIVGFWSPHVFSEDDAGWDYAESLLETVPKDLHIDPYGGLVVVDWAAKASPDLTFTDSERFDDTLRLDRARRSDLVNQAAINVDFRFPRLRHREIGLWWSSPTAWCDYLTYGFELCNRSTVEGAFSAAGWTVQGDITYTDIPEADVYTCGGVPRTWIGGQDMSSYCLGASATLARRWVQTVTETASITLTAPDSQERVGVLDVEAGYGIQATYDTTEWERKTVFDTPPVGASLNTAGDWVLDAEDATYDGRTAFDTAQVSAIAREKTRILDRHRRNTVTFSPVYRPDISMSQTIEVDTPGLDCKGKIRGYREQFDLDNGDLGLDIDIALSRHGGAGLASDDTVEAADKPAAPTEEFFPKTLYMGYHIGGLTTSPPDSDSMEGYICNATVIEDIDNLYQKRFRVVMPAVESTGRDAVESSAPKSIEVEIPEDDLTLTN